MLGQAELLEDPSLNVKLIKYILYRFDVHNYFPHPRESMVIDDVDYIHTDLIFEEYLLTHINDYNYEIYTFFSTAGLTVSNLGESVKVFGIYPDKFLLRHFVDCSELFVRENIPIIHINSSDFIKTK